MHILRKLALICAERQTWIVSINHNTHFFFWLLTTIPPPSDLHAKQRKQITYFMHVNVHFIIAALANRVETFSELLSEKFVIRPYSVEW
jgi:hypothetical protein